MSSYHKIASLIATRKVIDRLWARCFDKQAAFIRDPARKKAALCTRRAGKSECAAIYLLLTALLYPGSYSLYIALFRQSARDILWDKIKQIALSVGLTDVQFSESTLTLKFPNGSSIRLLGADKDENQRAKLLGPFYKLVIIDEAGEWTTNLHMMVDEVLWPALSDQQGTICLIGTPSDLIGPPDARTLFYSVTQEDTERESDFQDWSAHRWRALDNPHQRDKTLLDLERISRVRPGFMKTAEYKNMWLGQWAINESALVYRYTDANNGFPPGPCTQHVISVDLGFEDDTAFHVWGANPPGYDHKIFGLRSFKSKHLNFDKVAAQVRQLMLEYPQCQVVVDGANKQGVEHMREIHRIPFVIAKKIQKMDAIRAMNADLDEGRVLVSPISCRDLIDEWTTLIWDRDKQKEHDNCANHCADAALYGWRHIRHFMDTEAPQDRRSKEQRQDDDYFDKLTASHDPDW